MFATIRRYEEQIHALYARNDVTLFPPPGLEVSDSFFARWATDEDGNLQPGKLYVGVHAQNLPSMNVRRLLLATLGAVVRASGAGLHSASTLIVLDHLYLSGEMLAAILVTHHNIAFFLDTMRRVRQAIRSGEFTRFRREFTESIASGVE